jgi:hypothetical protein
MPTGKILRAATIEDGMIVQERIPAWALAIFRDCLFDRPPHELAEGNSRRARPCGGRLLETRRQDKSGSMHNYGYTITLKKPAALYAVGKQIRRTPLYNRQ